MSVLFYRWRVNKTCTPITAVSRNLAESVSVFEFKEHSRPISYSVVEFRSDLRPSSTPFGHAVKLMVVSCSLSGRLVLLLLPRMDMCIALRCPRRESPMYLFELIIEKLWPRPRELRSDERRCRLRIFLGTQHSRYLHEV